MAASPGNMGRASLGGTLGLTKKASSTSAIQRVVPPPAGSPPGVPRRADQRQTLRRTNSTVSSPAVPRQGACPSDSLKGTSTDARTGPPPTRLSETARPKSAGGSSGTAVAASYRSRHATACSRPIANGVATDRQAGVAADVPVASQIPESALAGRIQERLRSRLNDPQASMQMVALKLQKQQEGRAVSTGRSGRSSGAYPVSHSPVAARGPQSALAPSGGAASPLSPPAPRDARSSVRTPARGARPTVPLARSAKAPPGATSPTTASSRPSVPSRVSPATTRAQSLSRTSPAEATQRCSDASCMVSAARALQSRGASPPRTSPSPSRSRRSSPPPPRQTSPSPMRQVAMHTRSAACLTSVADAKASDAVQGASDAISSPGDLGRMASIANLLERADDMPQFTTQALQTADLQGKLAMLQQVATCGACTPPPRLWPPSRPLASCSGDDGAPEALHPAVTASIAGQTLEGLKHANGLPSASTERSMAEVEQENRELRRDLKLLTETLYSMWEACGSPPHTLPVSKSLGSCASPLGKQAGSPGIVCSATQLSWPTVEVNTPEIHWQPRSQDASACPNVAAQIPSPERAGEVASAPIAAPPAEQKVPSPAEKLLPSRTTTTTTFAWLQPELSLTEDTFCAELVSGLRTAAIAEESLARASLESTRSIDSGMLPQNMDRAQVYRPHSVPPLNLSGLMGNPSDSEEGSEAPVDNTIRSEGSWQNATGFAVRSAAEACVDPTSPQKMQASHLPMRAGSSSASTRAGSTPSCNNANHSNVLSPSSGKRSSHTRPPARPAWCMEARQLPTYASPYEGLPSTWPPFDAGLPSGCWPPTLAQHGNAEVQAQ